MVIFVFLNDYFCDREEDRVRELRSPGSQLLYIFMHEMIVTWGGGVGEMDRGVSVL